MIEAGVQWYNSLSENDLRLGVGEKNSPARAGDFDPLNMFKGGVFLLSIFLKLN